MAVKYPEERWAWVEVDLDAIKRNTRKFKSLVGPRNKLMCVVKADAYGHGAVPCAKAMHMAGANQFAVATVAEGVALRKGGINPDIPILILNQPPLASIDTLIEYELMPSIFEMDFALVYGERADSLGRVGRYHLIVDTGMTRTGALPEDTFELRRLLDFHRGLECAGTYTHFATADVIEDWDFKLQCARFTEMLSAFDDAGLDPGLVHCDNTPGTILHPRMRFDMCRVGIGLYGLHPANTTRSRIELEPAMSVRGRATRVVEPQVGAGVGYGLTYRVPKQGIRIATMGIGYADGLSRTLSGQMDVIVNGVRARQVGNICMDQFMFAVDPHGPRGYRPTRMVEVGDIVTVMGADGQEFIGADELAKLMGTINYEVVCDFGLRLEKVYV